MLRFLSSFLSRNKPDNRVFIKAQKHFKKVDQSLPVSHYDFVVFDTELTGLDLRSDEIIAIGGVRVRNLKIMAGETFHTYVRPDIYPTNNHTLIHRITPQQLETAPKLEEILPEFVDFCGPALLVGHYVDLDVKFINRAAKKFFNAELANPCLDTMRLAQLYTEKCWQHYYDRYNYNLYNLDSLSNEYKLPLFTRHDALQDALQTAYLFVYLIKKLQRHGLVTLKDFYTAGQSWKNIF